MTVREARKAAPVAPPGPLPVTLNRSLQATATLVTTQLYNAGAESAVDAAEWPFARISEILDSRTCPLCASLNGMVVRIDSPEYRRFRDPSHIGCRRLLTRIHRDVDGVKVTFSEPAPELIRKHGHFHLRPDRYAEYRMPAQPAGRQIIVRRVRNLETGKLGVQLDWAPWWEQVPNWKRELVLQARAAAKREELTEILRRLGITDAADPEQLRQATLLGLRDRLEGWVTIRQEPGPFVQVLTAAEDEIKGRATEKAYAFRADGTKVLEKVGEESYVEFTDAEIALMVQNNAVLTHNHPNGSSFSDTDIKFVCTHGLPEIRATTTEWRHSMRPPDGGWSEEFWRDVVKPSFKIRDAEVTSEIWPRVWSGELTPDEANRLHWHEVWTRVAADTGLKYEREAW